jgi:hypothetical protein
VAAAAAGEEICTQNFGERDQRIDLGESRGMDSGGGRDALTGEGAIRRAADCEAEAEARPRRRRAARRAAMAAGEGAGGGGRRVVAGV